MLREALQSPDVVAALLQDGKSTSELAALLGSNAPPVIVTVARGSSDHAASYFAYLVMMTLGIPVSSLPLSLATLHRVTMRTNGALSMAFSQSGRSPDLVAGMQMLSLSGARTVAVVNASHSPLEAMCTHALPVGAGPEMSVAATKSYVGMLARSAQLVGMWSQRVRQSSSILAGLACLPETLSAASRVDWSSAVENLAHQERMFVIGRGAGLAVAMEAALKLKETCGIQAEAFSSAEVRHGPMEIINQGFPILIFAPEGPEQNDLVKLARDMRERGSSVILAASQNIRDGDCPLVSCGVPALDPIAAILSFYIMAAQLATARGRDPDNPRFLRKVTETV